MQVMRSIIRSTTVSSKQAEAVMTDHTSKTHPSPIHPPLFRPSTYFPARFPADPAAVTMTTPVAVLHGRPTCPSIWNAGSPPRSSEKHSWERGLGLALLELLQHEGGSRRKVLIGPHLNIRIPPSLHSSPSHHADAGNPLSMEEMELSENYTCVITHGPKPRTTHIFDDCVVEKLTSLSSDHDQNPTLPWLDFLSFCDGCKKKLGQDRDIYIYRGEKAFCSEECRSQAIHFDEGEFYWP